MRCLNNACQQEIREGIPFCPHCGAQQFAAQDRRPPAPAASPAPPPAPSPPRVSGDLGYSSAWQVAGVSPAAAPNFDTTLETIVLRASQQIWDWEEPEGRIEPGKRRPMLVWDEQTIHLAHTDRWLQPEELLNRVRFLIQAYAAPVKVQLVYARWIKDYEEWRPRLIASLHDHSYSDVKMIMGVDYLGRWASLQLQIATEPEPMAPPPPPPSKPQKETPIGAVILIGIGLMLFVAGIAVMVGSRRNQEGGVVTVILGIFVAIIGFIWASMAGSNATQRYEQEKAAWEAEIRKQEAEIKRRETEKVVEKLSRTFKVDDIRLFGEAMQHVFRAVANDIVKQGAKVVRIEGGSGGFFQAYGQGQPAPATRRGNAGQSDI